MIGNQQRWQEDLFVAGTLSSLIPSDHILKQVDKVLDLSWLRGEVADCYSETMGRPSIDPESALRLMLAGYFQGIVHDRKLMREAQVNLAIRWFAGFRLDETLPEHSSLTKIRQRWGPDRFKKIFQKTVQLCIDAGLVNGETVHIDSTLIRADVSWESLTTEYADKAIIYGCYFFLLLTFLCCHVAIPLLPRGHSVAATWLFRCCHVAIPLLLCCYFVAAMLRCGCCHADILLLPYFFDGF